MKRADAIVADLVELIRTNNDDWLDAFNEEIQARDDRHWATIEDEGAQGWRVVFEDGSQLLRTLEAAAQEVVRISTWRRVDAAIDAVEERL